jgi:hypothetical protein
MEDVTYNEFVALLTCGLDEGIIGHFIEKWLVDGNLKYIMMYTELVEKNIENNHAMGITLQRFFSDEIHNEAVIFSKN